MTSFIDFIPYKNVYPSLTEYANGLKRSLNHYADIKKYSTVNSDQSPINKRVKLNHSIKSELNAFRRSN